MLDYKDIITKHYAMGMSGMAIAKSLNASPSGVNGFLRAFKACKKLGYPLPQGITNYGIAEAVYGKNPGLVGRNLSYEMPDYETVSKDLSSRKNMTLVVLWNRYAKKCRDDGLNFTRIGSSARITPSGVKKTRRRCISMPSLARRWKWILPGRPFGW